MKNDIVYNQFGNNSEPLIKGFFNILRSKFLRIGAYNQFGNEFSKN